MQYLFRLVFLLVPLTALAQSSLPPCPLSGIFHMCFGGMKGTNSDGAEWTYVGEFKNDKFHGQGTYTWSDGEQYVGEFKDDSITGQGTRTFPNGAQYVGQYKNGKRHGQGTQTSPTGEKFAGEFTEGKRKGLGIYIWADGIRDVGEWSDDKLNGQGIRYQRNGSVLQSGRWVDGKLEQSFAIDIRRFPFNLDETTFAIKPAPGPAQVEAKFRPIAQIKREDENIELLASRWLRSALDDRSRVVATAYNRRVLLTGEVPDEATKKLAEETVSKLANVEMVINELVFSPVMPVGQQANDMLLAGRVKAALIDSDTPSLFALKLIANRGSLYLLGPITKDESARVVEVASKVSGVNRVMRIFQIFTKDELARILDPKNATDSLQTLAPVIQNKASEPVERNELTLRHSPVVASRNERRVALIVGNAKYAYNPLDNPVNDASDLDAALKSLGFKTTLLRDATMAQMRNATRQFADDVATSDVALIFFAGHGIEARGRNYLLPVSADIKHEFELEDQAYDAGRWLDMLENIKGTNRQRINIVILDACRNNDLARGWRSSSRGLARMDAPTGTFIAFATAPGKVAMDGAKGQRNSPFTKNLLRAIQTPDVPIELMFKEVRRLVLEDTKNEQVPWDNSSLVGDFVFKKSR
jgi:osmotically-inducible protein OsmY